MPKFGPGTQKAKVGKLTQTVLIKTTCLNEKLNWKISDVNGRDKNISDVNGPDLFSSQKKEKEKEKEKNGYNSGWKFGRKDRVISTLAIKKRTVSDFDFDFDFWFDRLHH